ncbi:hypothetical protein KP509_17G011100 [Ceratopteris richardii]|nr:hypothetical protein KP509_17G011100 [Ceratopteris richardii]
MRGSKTELGLIGLSVHDVFKHIQKMKVREYLIRVSYMEIYNEDINDLLAPQNRKLQVHENLEKGIFVAGLREEIVSSPSQVFELLEFGEAHRHVGQTNMNIYSSRSHTIFRMVIESKDKNELLTGACSSDAVRVSVLNLVDLAGSERVAKTGAGGVRLKEGTHINKSLMTLGNVIKKLSDGAARQGGHIPYRDSKLTRILQPALGGNAKTAIICTIAPDEIHIDETRGTLLFASRAKRVTTCAQVNEIITDAALLKRQQKEIEDLRRKLKGSQSDISEQEILRLRKDLLRYELEKERLELELQEERRAQMERDQRIKEQELRIENLSSLVITSAFDDALNKENGKHLENRQFQNNALITVRRERQLSPLNFELLSEKSSEKCLIGSRRELDFEGMSNFENIADEDLWATMNDGLPVTDPEFLFSTPNRWASSVGSTKGRASSSVIGVLMSSKAKIQQYKGQLEEVQKENSELRAQLKDSTTFEAELHSALMELKDEFWIIKNSTKAMDDFRNILNDAKLGFSSLCSELRLEEKQIESGFVKATRLTNTHMRSLSNRIFELEAELSKVRVEKVELQTHCQIYSEQIQRLTENFTKEGSASCTKAPSRSPGAGQELGFPFVSVENDACMNSAEAFGQINGIHKPGEELHFKHQLDSKVLEMGAEPCSMQKDRNICVSDDSWLRRKRNKGDSVDECFTSAMQDRNAVSADVLMCTKADDKSDFNKLECMTQMFLMSQEHIRALEKQLSNANLERERFRTMLQEQLSRHEKSMAAMKLQKRRFAQELKSIMEAIAIQDNFVTSICLGIQGFDNKQGQFKCQSILGEVPIQ